MGVPNRYQTVIDVANKYPREFREAHTDGPNKHLWIKLLAYELFQSDPNFGLNGKRGNPNDLSMDAINWKGGGVGYDPTRNESAITVIDVIAGAGGVNPTPAWQVFNKPETDRGPGAWVRPDPVPGYHSTGETPKEPEVEATGPTNTDVVNELTKVVGALNAVIASNERFIQVQEQTVAALVEQLKITTHYQTESSGAVKDAVNALNARLDRGFVIGAKGGWPVGNINGTLTLKAQD